MNTEHNTTLLKNIMRITMYYKSPLHTERLLIFFKKGLPLNPDRDLYLHNLTEYKKYEINTQAAGIKSNNSRDKKPTHVTRASEGLDTLHNYSPH